MNLTKLYSLAILLVVPFSSLVAQTQPLTPTEKKQMLETINKIKTGVIKGRTGVNSAALAAYRGAASSNISAYEFYLKCYKEMNFTRKGAKESEYRDWKAKNKDYLSSREHGTARRLQLQFLILTIRAANLKEEERDSLIPELITLMDNCISAYPYIGKSKRILSSGATGSTFAQVYDLQSTLVGLKNWPRSPMDVSGIYESTIMPRYRTTETVKELMQAWDKRMSQEIKIVASENSSEAEANFKNKTLPKLKWFKYMDLLRAGQTREALTLMVTLVRTNPDHENIDEWLDDLEGYISGKVDPGTFEEAEKKRKEAEVANQKSKSANPAGGLGNTNIDDARKALEGLNLGGGRNGGRRGIPENVDIDQIRELFNRR